MPKIITATEAVKLVQEHSRIMFGSFLTVGAALNLIDALTKQGTKNLHIIAISPDYNEKGIGKLVANKQVKSAQISWHGACKASQEQYNSGELDIEFNPQGVLLERIRANGAGLGGVLSIVGLGTIIEEQRETIVVDGKKYILERPIAADFAFVRAYKADKMGNLIYRKSMRNANPVMATSGNITIAEVDEIVEIGELDPESIITSGIYVNYIVKHAEQG